MKPHIKVIQRNGVDIFVTSSMEMKPVKSKPYSIVASEMVRRSQAMTNSAYNCMLHNAGMANSLWSAYDGVNCHSNRFGL